MYQKEADENELASFGLTKSDVAVTVEIWRENYQAFNLFSNLSTQWRYSMNGVTGLDYNVLFHKLDRMNLTDDEYAWLEDDVRIMEHIALTELNKKKD